jgi:hypothetical protein
MKTFELYSEFNKDFPNLIEEDLKEFETHMRQDDPTYKLEDQIKLTWGGSIFVVETLDDLFQIQTGVFEKRLNRYLSIIEKSDVFDVFRLIGNFYMIGNITNNAGGDTYIVPKDLLEQCPNAVKSCILTRKEYCNAADQTL